MIAIRPRSPFHLNCCLVCQYFFIENMDLNVLDILSTLGFAVTYKETLMYEVVIVYHPQPHILSPESGALILYIADNADINVYTIDSYNTAHIMGIIKIITPISAVIAEEPIAKYKTSTAKDFGSRMYP